MSAMFSMCFYSICFFGNPTTKTQYQEYLSEKAYKYVYFYQINNGNYNLDGWYVFH